MFHYTIGRDPKIDPASYAKSITYRITTPANCSSWAILLDRHVAQRGAARSGNFATGPSPSVALLRRSTLARSHEAPDGGKIGFAGAEQWQLVDDDDLDRDHQIGGAFCSGVGMEGVRPACALHPRAREAGFLGTPDGRAR